MEPRLDCGELDRSGGTGGLGNAKSCLSPEPEITASKSNAVEKHEYSFSDPIQRTAIEPTTPMLRRQFPRRNAHFRCTVKGKVQEEPLVASEVYLIWLRSKVFGPQYSMAFIFTGSQQIGE